MAVRLKSQDNIEKMRAAGRIVQKVHQRCREMCKPGVTTREVDEAAYELYTSLGAKGLFKNYPTYREGEGFPSNLCISVNEVVVHGIADDRKIEDGDIVGVDCGVKINGWCGDAATTILVGNVAPEVRKLCEVTEHILTLAIENIQPGRRWSQVARLMQSYAEQHGYGVVKEFVGHGIGQDMHEDPKVPNYVSRQLLRNDIELREGMVLAIEPMCNLGSSQVLTLDDGWTVVTADRKPSAHYEHTVAVTSDGADVLTDGR
ncbi:type I methionyl aminopeptidase [Phycisphaerales bacterium AB-hyl4]|uniref:Methionine aminopeptidase n=1 Tax=Natronomicrosphaera hydrolytica TaxID=3242702 RepID=A0ABV4U885_9BACT